MVTHLNLSNRRAFPHIGSLPYLPLDSNVTLGCTVLSGSVDNHTKEIMSYTIHQLATIAGVSVRTLHHYDTVGLLSPTRDESNQYRQYTHDDALRLQQILFFRELGFSLDKIRAMLDAPEFDMRAALKDQRALLKLHQERYATLLDTVDQTLTALTKDTTMDTNDLFNGLSKDEIDAYAAEAKARWGTTDAYKQSMERTKQMTKNDWQRLSEQSHALLTKLVTAMPNGATSTEAQVLIAEHYESLRTFYDPTPQIYRGLAEMYVADPRFAANYTKYHPDLPQFMRDAMVAYADTLEA